MEYENIMALVDEDRISPFLILLNYIKLYKLKHNISLTILVTVPDGGRRDFET